MSNLNLNDFIEEDQAEIIHEVSGKESVITMLLCLFLGFFGMHSIYAGRTKSGITRLIISLLCIVFALMQNKISCFFFFITFVLTILDFVKIAGNNYFDNEKKLIQASTATSIFFKILAIPYFVIGGLIVFALLITDPAPDTVKSNYENPKQKEVATKVKQSAPVSERSYESLQSCAGKDEACSEELNKRLEIAIQHIDSVYGEGRVREAVKLSSAFYKILKSDGSGIPFANYAPTVKGIEKRIEKLLPAKGCFSDSVQYANYFSTIYEVEIQHEMGNKEFDYTKYFNYLNRGCKLNHYDINVIITEERFIAAALKNKSITKAKANLLYNEIFKLLSEDDFVPMTLVNQGKAYKGYGTIEKKKNRTVSYVEAPSKDMNDATALVVSVFDLFSFGAYMPFTLHPSVENVEIGFNISELEFNPYVGYYHGIYAVTIKTDKKTLDKYYEKNDINPPRTVNSDIAISEKDKEFFSSPLTYRDIKKWCARNGFTCSKYLVERTR